MTGAARIWRLQKRDILKNAKLCAKDANLCAKDAKWVTGNVGVLGVLGVLAVQKLLSRRNHLTDSSVGDSRDGGGPPDS